MQLQYNFKNISHTFHGTWFILLFTAHSQEAMLKKICCFFDSECSLEVKVHFKMDLFDFVFHAPSILFCLCAVAI